jgi:hypothetical protein
VKDLQLRAGVALTLALSGLKDSMQEIRSDASERGDGPIPTVIIVLATIAGAALIAGTLAVLYGKYNGKLLGK